MVASWHTLCGCGILLRIIGDAVTRTITSDAWQWGLKTSFNFHSKVSQKLDSELRMHNKINSLYRRSMVSETVFIFHLDGSAIELITIAKSKQKKFRIAGTSTWVFLSASYKIMEEQTRCCKWFTYPSRYDIMLSSSMCKKASEETPWKIQAFLDTREWPSSKLA